MAEERFFVQVKRELMRRPTFSSFNALLNNFAAETGLTEALTKERQAEEIRFLNAVMATPAMKFAHKYLAAKGLSPAEEAAFKKQLWDIWFQPYNRTRGVRVRV